MGFVTANSFTMLRKSMDYLWVKQTAILDNIANVETPNYKTKIVTFEESLRDRLEQAAGSNNPRREIREILENAEFAVVEYDEATRMDDNSVNLTEQSVELVRNSYQIQYVMQAINGTISGLRTAITG